MSEQKIVIQQQQSDGSYQELWPKNDSWTKKQGLLSTTSQSYDLPENATPDDVFQNIRVRLNLIGSGQAYLLLTLMDSNNNKLSGVKVSGFSDGDLYSDDNGIVKGYISVNNPTIKVTGYADIEDASKAFAPKSGEFLTDSFVLSPRSFLKIVSSKNCVFSPNVQSVDVSVGGAGGAGVVATTGNSTAKGGYGGGYGAVATQLGITVNHNTAYLAVVGAGTSSTGGQSSFLGVNASGGTAGAGGYGAISRGYTSDYDAADGVSGTQTIFSSFTETTLYGGTGGGGAARYGSYSGQSAGSGGSPGGGAGGRLGQDGNPGLANTGGGGGGGGAEYRPSKDRDDRGDGGFGGSGVVAIRMHLKTSA